MYQTPQDQGDRIQKFQKSKEEGMAIMAANRDATMIVCELIRADRYKGSLNESALQEQILYWRKWFYVNIYDTTPDKQMKQEAKNELNSIPF